MSFTSTTQGNCHASGTSLHSTPSAMPAEADRTMRLLTGRLGFLSVSATRHHFRKARARAHSEGQQEDQQVSDCVFEMLHHGR